MEDPIKVLKLFIGDLNISSLKTKAILMKRHNDYDQGYCDALDAVIVALSKRFEEKLIV